MRRGFLGRFGWSGNVAVLHSDVRLMPRSKLAWSCWNYLTTSVVGDGVKKGKANVDRVSLTYGMNDLQHLSEKRYGPVLVTLNPPFEPKEELTVGRWNYEHPILDGDAILSQREMPEIQGTRHISYAGAYLKYGFHEDGFTSGLRAVADHIPNVNLPFDIRYADTEPQKVVLGGLFFDLMEATGGRWVLGLVLGTVLGWVRGVLGLFFDLRHLKEGHSAQADRPKME